MRKLTKFVLSVLTGTMIFSMTAFASEFSVTPANAVFYTNENTIALMDASEDAQVVLPSCDINLPIQVTGVTSNGYWQIVLGNETYYVAGIGLSPEAGNAMVADNANTTAPATTTPTQTASKYVCVIEDGDEELYESKTYDNWGSRNVRQDWTGHELYIHFRDQLENAYASGENSFRYEKGCQCYELSFIIKNMCVDFMKTHPDVEGMCFAVKCPTASMKNPFRGTEYANYVVAYVIKYEQY